MQELFSEIWEKYGVGEVLIAERISKGFLSENFVLSTASGKWFLKRYRPMSEARVREIHAAKKFFHDGGVPVILPVETKKGETFFAHEGSFYALFPFVSGLQPERFSQEMTDEMIVSLGQTLARMHLLGKGSDLKCESEKADGWDKKASLETAGKLEKVIKNLPRQTEFDALAFQTIALKKKLIEDNKVRLEDLRLTADHLIHGDYHDQNVFWDSKGKISHVFDFEKTRYTPRTSELFRSALYSFFDEDTEMSLERIHMYLRAYLEIYPMSDRELYDGFLAHRLGEIHGFWIEKEHYFKNNTRVDELLKSSFLRIKFFSERPDVLEFYLVSGVTT
ncbi:MAG TPA: phosphotransferase [Candidatus Paceibacterota bacterium]|nr:phosphotransferase [Candidatus Paceibacterota bacterium]